MGAALLSVAVSAAVWLAVQHEVDELLDDTLEASAEVLVTLLAPNLGGLRGAADEVVPRVDAGTGHERLAWQVVRPGASPAVLLRSQQAPGPALRESGAPGFFDLPDWRVFGMPLDDSGHMLFVAQRREERREASFDVALSSALAALVVGWLGAWWVRRRVRRELEPLQSMSEALARLDPLGPGATLGPAQREELQPVHEAIDDLGRRLARRVWHERAVAAHAAHALRTPLAGIDAQLAVALRESPPELLPRLRRVRAAADRLQRVVTALLAMFRSGAEARREPVMLSALLSRLPVDGLEIAVDPDAEVEADPDLLAAALLNLLDNALRHGAKQVHVGVPRPQVVGVRDDGPGMEDGRRAAILQALRDQAYEGAPGLGLVLADLVARAHGGALALPPASEGLLVELRLGPPADGVGPGASGRSTSA